MKKSTILSFAAVSLAAALIGGCSFPSGGDKESEGETTRVDPTINVFGEYAVMAGFTQYASPDGGFSIQLPEGSAVDDANLGSVTITVAGGYENPDLINISKNAAAQQLHSTAELMKMLESDNSIDITGYFNINKDGAYEGYKYTYTAMDNPSLKGIVSVFFSDDGSAYTVNATINNGADEANVTMINTILDTFINYG